MTTITSTNASSLPAAAAADAVRITAEHALAATAPLAAGEGAPPSVGSLDLNKIGADEARTLMSAEHKALGYRPPPGSLAAEAQAAAAKHPDAHADVPAAVLREAAVEDAARIAAERKTTDVDAPPAHAGIDLEKVGQAEARTLMSAEHKALGYRPPPGSLAAEAQAAAAKHPAASAGIPETALREAAREDAARIARQRDPDVAPTVGASIDLAHVGEKDAAAIASAEHTALGFRPPPGSLASEAHAAAARHPDADSGASAADLRGAGRDDALRIQDERGEGAPVDAPAEADASINLDTITRAEARELQSEEQKMLGYRPPPGSLAAEAQSAADRHAEAIATKSLARAVQSEEHHALGHRPPAGSAAAVAQSLADKNEADGGERKLGEGGL